MYAYYYYFSDNTNQHLCPAPTSAAPATNAISDVIHSGTQVEIKPPETCSWPTALQVCFFVYHIYFIDLLLLYDMV